MKLGTRIMLSVSALALLGGIVMNSNRVLAVNSPNDKLAHALAVRFNLREDDVESFLNDYETNRSDTHITSQQSDHVQFIDDKLSEAVDDKWITKQQKKDVMAKLKEMMKSNPSSSAFENMSSDRQNEVINTWKKEMRKWAVDHNLTLDQIRNLTGKGNKYLMGISL